MASKLLVEFGSLGAIFSGDESRSRRLDDFDIMTHQIIDVVAELLIATRKQRALTSPVFSARHLLYDYLFADMAFRPVECLRVIYLNARRALIADELTARGSLTEVGVYVRSIIKRAIDLAAKHIIIVHNHPSGDPKPSKADIQITQHLANACTLFDLQLDDHLVVAASGLASFKEHGLL